MTARITALPMAALAGLAVLAAACGGGAATNAPGATQGAATQAAATQGPAATGGSGASFDTSSFHADVELESLFPKQIGGADLTVLSMAGDEFLDGASPELEAALTTLNKQPSDLSVAFGGGPTATIIAFQIDGAPGGTILDAIFQAYQADDESTVSDITISGKSVKKVTPKDPDEDVSYIYTSRDVVFSVGGGGGEAITQAALDEVFSKLP